MRLDGAVGTVEQRGTLDLSNAQALTIDASGLQFIMSILSNLYSNGSLAVVREYACNARDSHVEAGNPDPILITLPTVIDPQLRVQDFGVGLSRDDILRVYSNYGSSTKRDSNTQIGAFGIGSKSAFTVGNQFMVTGVKDGWRTIALFAVNEKKMPAVSILDHSRTDEPNGVLVDIGVEDVDAVRAAADKLFTTWDQGTVLVNGKRPVSVWEKSRKITDELYLSFPEQAMNYDETHFQVIMGGVAYAIPSALLDRLSTETRKFIYRVNNQSQVVYRLVVEIGAVDITPSREELQVTNTTVATIQRLLTTLETELPTWISGEFDKADSLFEAAKLYRQISMKMQFFDAHKLTWRGKSFGDKNIIVPFTTFKLVNKSRTSHSRDLVCTKHDGPTNVNILEDWSDTLVVINVPDGKTTTVHRYGKAIMEDGHHKQLIASDHKQLIASDVDHYSNGWFAFGAGTGSTMSTIDFEDFRQKGLQLRRENQGTSGEPRSKTVYSVEGHDDDLTAEEINSLGQPVALVRKSDYISRGTVVQRALKGYTVVNLTGAKKVEVFQKKVHNVSLAMDVIREYAVKVVNNLNKAQKELLNANSFLASVDQKSMKWLLTHEAEITNPTILAHMNEYRDASLLNNREASELQTILEAHRLAAKAISSVHVDGALIPKHFPLLSSYLDTNRYYSSASMSPDKRLAEKHIIHYLNTTTI